MLSGDLSGTWCEDLWLGRCAKRRDDGFVLFICPCITGMREGCVAVSEGSTGKNCLLQAGVAAPLLELEKLPLRCRELVQEWDEYIGKLEATPQVPQFFVRFEQQERWRALCTLYAERPESRTCRGNSMLWALRLRRQMLERDVVALLLFIEQLRLGNVGCYSLRQKVWQRVESVYRRLRPVAGRLPASESVSGE